MAVTYKKLWKLLIDKDMPEAETVPVYDKSKETA